MKPESCFDFRDDDHYAASVALDVARRLLASPKVTPQQVVGLGHALAALESLPDVLPGAYVEFGIEYWAGEGDALEMRFISVHVSETVFEISSGGSIFDGGVPGTSSRPESWCVQVDGFRETNLALCYVEDHFIEFLNLGAKNTVEDDSDIEFDVESD